MQHPVVKVIHDAGCQSYVIGCPVTGSALIVDPKVGRRQTYRQCLQDFGLKGVALLDTHTHADHLSDSVAFLKEGWSLYMSRLTRCRRDLVRIGDGDLVRVGELTFRVHEVPGHTEDSIALVGHGLALVGDTLFAGSLARADFRGSDPARLFDSVTSRLMTLPDDTVVLPGHDYRDVLFTTIGHERGGNPHLQHRDGAAYAAALHHTDGAGNSPDVDEMLRLNQEANPTLPEVSGSVAACCAVGGGGPMQKAREQRPDELAPRREEIVAGGLWLDVRDRCEVAAGGIPGVRNIPLGELGFHLAELRGRAPLVLSCQGGVRSMTAARTLRYLGVTDDPISMAGGFRAWGEAGLPIQRPGASG